MDRVSFKNSVMWPESLAGVPDADVVAYLKAHLDILDCADNVHIRYIDDDSDKIYIRVTKN